MSATVIAEGLAIVVADDQAHDHHITVSPRCPRCARPRTPIRMEVGRPRLWAHPCGHIDSAASLLAEAAVAALR